MPEYLGQRIMAWGADHIVAFDDHPRGVRIDGPRAAIVHVWEDLEVPSWTQPSVNLEPPTVPYLAIDPKRARFAIAEGDHVVVIAAEPWRRVTQRRCRAAMPARSLRRTSALEPEILELVASHRPMR